MLLLNYVGTFVYSHMRKSGVSKHIKLGNAKYKI